MRVCACGIVAVPLLVSAQLRNVNWVYSKDMWLKYWGDTLSYQASPYEPTLRSACMSDAYGNLLMVVDDRGIHDALFNLMPEGDSLTLDWTEQSSNYLILPEPGTSARYMVFRSEASGERRAGWVEVDMEANNGMGGVISGTHWYASNLTAKLAATPHANGTDYWVMHHEDGSDAFLAFQVAQGAVLPPVTSHQGGAFTSTSYPSSHPDFYGGMKFSVQGDKLALLRLQGSVPDTALTELLHFNDATGEVLFWANLKNFYWTWLFEVIRDYSGSLTPVGLEFDATGDHLYVTVAGDSMSLSPSGNLCIQFTLADEDPDSLQATSVRAVGNSNGDGTIQNDVQGSQLQLAPSGEIIGRQVNTDQTEWIPSIWRLVNLPVPITYTFEVYNSSYYTIVDVLTATHSDGFPTICKRYHDSEPIWLGTPSANPPSRYMVRPNPVTDRAVLDVGTGEQPSVMRWIDTMGREVLRSNAVRTGPSILIDRKQLSSGSYNVLLYEHDRLVGSVVVMCD